MHTMQSCWNCLTKIISFAAEDETSSAHVEPEAQREPSILQEIRRAHVLITRVESTGVKFPALIHEALERARVAHERDRWMMQIERDFYDALSLLESIVRPSNTASMKSADRSGNATRRDDEPGWTIIISSRRRALDASY